MYTIGRAQAHRRNKLHRLALSGLLLIIGSLLISSCGEESVKVGFSGRLSGIHSDLGVAARNGARLAVEDVNEDGGIGGAELKLLVENDENSPEGAIAADKKLISEGVVAIVGHITSTQTLAALPQLEERGIPLISPTASTPLLSGKSDNFFRLNPPADMTAEIIGSYAGGSLGANRIAVVYDSDNAAYSLPYTEAFIDAARSHAAEVVLRESFSSSEAFDWPGIVEELEEAACDAVLIVASAADTALFARSAKSAGADFHILSSGWAYTENLLLYGGSAAEGILFADSFNEGIDREEFVRFERRYQERFGNVPNFAAVHGYEAILFLRKGLEMSRRENSKLIEALSSIESMESLSGTLKFTRCGDVIRPFFISKVENGSFKTVGRMDAEFER